MKLIAAGASLMFALNAFAADVTVDPLWAKTTALAKQARAWVPHDMDVNLDVTAEGKHEIIFMKSELSGWEKGKPTYKVVKIEPAPKPGEKADKGTAKFDEFSGIADELFNSKTPPARKDGQMIDGKAYTLFTKNDAKGPADMAVKMWVDPDTGVPLKTELKVHTMFVIDLFMRINYAPHPQAGFVAAKSMMDMEVLIPFVGAQVHIKGESSKFVQRP